MADNVAYKSDASATVSIIRTNEDTVGGGQVQYVKLMEGAAGTFNIVSSTNPLPVSVQNVHSADFDTGAGTDTTVAMGIALPGDGGAVVGGTSDNPIRTDPTGTTAQPVSGTVTVNAGTGTFAISHTALTALASAIDGGMVDVNISAQAGALSVSGTVTANAGTGTFAVSNSGLTELAAAINDNKVDVQIAGQDANVTVAGTVTANAGTGTMAVSNSGLTELAAAINDNKVDVQIAGTDAPVEVDLAANNDVQGAAAHDAAVAGNPFLGAAEADAHGANPTAVAEGDVVRIKANRAGVPWVIGGHPNVVTETCRVDDADNAQTNTIIHAAAPGTKIVVTRLSIIADNANTGDVRVIVGFGDTLAADPGATGTTKILHEHPGVPAGGGITIGDGSGILGVGGDGDDLRYTCEDPTGGAIAISVSYYTIES